MGVCNPNLCALVLIYRFSCCFAADDGLDTIRSLLNFASSDQLERAFRKFQTLGSCGKKRDVVAALESERIFDANWDAETGEMFDSIKEARQKDPWEFAFMVERAFSSGADYLTSELNYLECISAYVREHGFQPYLRILKKEGMTQDGGAATQTAVLILLLATTFDDGQLLVSQHFNEFTVDKMKTSIAELLQGEEQTKALRLVSDYGALLPRIDRQTQSLGILFNGLPETVSSLAEL